MSPAEPPTPPTPTLLAREVLEALIDCVYAASDSSTYWGGGGRAKVEQTIADMIGKVEAAEAIAVNGGSPTPSAPPPDELAPDMYPAIPPGPRRAPPPKTFEALVAKAGPLPTTGMAGASAPLGTLAPDPVISGMSDTILRLRAELDKATDALGDAAARFRVLHKIAVNPMKSWDAGHVIDAQRVEDEAGDALEAIDLALAAPSPRSTTPAAPACTVCGSTKPAHGAVMDGVDGAPPPTGARERAKAMVAMLTIPQQHVEWARNAVEFALIEVDRDRAATTRELEAYRRGEGTWVDENGEEQPRARTFRAMWNGLRHAIEQERAKTSRLRTELRACESRLEDTKAQWRAELGEAARLLRELLNCIYDDVPATNVAHAEARMWLTAFEVSLEGEKSQALDGAPSRAVGDK